MASILETIARRISVRSYSPEPIPAEKLKELNGCLQEITEGPFGTPLRFACFDESQTPPAERKKLGTYGMIQGDQFYIAGAARKGAYAEIDYGYQLERVILKATELELGTCWLGGTLNRSSFAQKIGLTPGEIMPAVTPVGVPADLKRLKIILLQNLIGARTRKAFDQLFFDGSAAAPLRPDRAAEWQPVLEAVRSGPSASNKQPWRIIKTPSHFHFCLNQDPLYNSAFKDFMIQKVDLGIALCHFELSARELGLGGAWELSAASVDTGKFTHYLSWRYA